MKKLLFLFCLSLLFGCTKDQELLNDTPATQAQAQATDRCGPRDLYIRYTQGKLKLVWYRLSGASDVPANHYRVQISRAFQLDTVVVGKSSNELEIMCEIPLEGSIAVSISCVEHGMSVYQEYTRKANLPDPHTACTYDIGHASGYYEFSTSGDTKTMTVYLNRSGDYGTEHEGSSRVEFYSDRNLTQYLFDFYYFGSELSKSIDITSLNKDRIFVVIRPPYECSTGSYTTKHYFVGEAPYDRYQESGSQTFSFSVVNL